ncbi:MAG: IS1595 family transposase [Verrucomicrobiota bacterium]|jgi:transposase-like protein
MKTEQTELDANELNLVELAQQYSDNDKARELLESLRWPNGPVCPHCQNDGKAKPIYRLEPKATSKAPARKGVYKCGACRKQFTVTVGTVFEASHIPISKWLLAVFILCSGKKSTSSHQMHRMLKVTYKTAWFMTHRIRFAMGLDDSDAPPLTGTVECDETYVGGKGDMKTKVVRKTPVIALVQRGGAVRTQVVPNVTQLNLRKIITAFVSKSATLNTDDSGVYRGRFKDYARHDIVNHSNFEYTRQNADGTKSGVNGCESFFSLLKRGVVGSWHHVSREHLPKYAGEFEFRWNTRGISDGARMVKAIESVEGKRLTYRQVV